MNPAAYQAAVYYSDYSCGICSALIFVQINASRMSDSLIQDLISECVSLREKMQQAAQASDVDIMPVIITASTRASSTAAHQSKSGKSRVADIQLRPLSTAEMAQIALDIQSRCGLNASGELPNSLMSILRWLGGVPHLLAWAMCGLSGHMGRTMTEEVFLPGRPKPQSQRSF